MQLDQKEVTRASFYPLDGNNQMELWRRLIVNIADFDEVTIDQCLAR